MPRDKKPAIVLEGPDGSGKTTLAEKLCKALDLQYMHLTYLEDPEAMYAQFVEADKALQHGGVLLDRYIMSNYVYSAASAVPVVKHASKFLHDMQGLIRSNRVYHILCMPIDREVYLKEFERLSKVRDELHTSLMYMAYVYDEYIFNQAMLSSACGPENCLRYDRFGASVAVQLKYMLDRWPEDVPTEIVEKYFRLTCNLNLNQKKKATGFSQSDL